MMTNWCFKVLFPKEEQKTKMVVKLHDLLIATSEINFVNTVNWQSIFLTPGEKELENKLATQGYTFGAMMRRSQPSIRTASGVGYHNLFRLPLAEAVGYPYPFQRGAVKESDIIVKTRKRGGRWNANDVLYHSYEPHPPGASRDDIDKAQTRDNRPSKFELTFVIGGIVSMFSDVSSTFHSVQGSTRSNKVILDLRPMGTCENFDTMTIRSALLVGLTRTDISTNVIVSNADAVYPKLRDHNLLAALRPKRMHNMMQTRIDHFR